MSYLQIDAAQGEGGGQILRTALALSIITQTPVELKNIRAGRAKPGLMRQHLTGVLAAQTIADAKVEGAELGSTRLRFAPKLVRAGAYEFSVGTAGSAALVMQTLLWPLLQADQPSTLRIGGGTHVPMAPCYEFLQHSFKPALKKFGIEIDLRLIRHGFYPAGGGLLEVTIQPWREVHSLNLTERGAAQTQHGLVLMNGMDVQIGLQQIAQLQAQLGWDEQHFVHQRLSNAPGIANVILLCAQFAGHTEIISAYGGKQQEPLQAANLASAEMLAWLHSEAAVGEHLADQLLLPLALAGGQFSCNVKSSHLTTNAAIIQRFLPLQFEISQQHRDCFVVSV